MNRYDKEAADLVRTNKYLLGDLSEAADNLHRLTGDLALLRAQRDDLLAALEGMVADAEAIVEDYGIAACLCCADQCHYCAARAAIAKARGAK